MPQGSVLGPVLLLNLANLCFRHSTAHEYALEELDLLKVVVIAASSSATASKTLWQKRHEQKSFKLIIYKEQKASLNIGKFIATPKPRRVFSLFSCGRFSEEL